MAENNDPAPGENEDATAVDGPVPPANEAVPAPAAPRFQDRVWSFRAMIAVGLAALLFGGAGGAAIAAVSGGDDNHHHRFGHRGPGPGPGFGGPGAFERGPGMDGIDPYLRREMRQDLRQMRKEFRDKMDKLTKPTPSATPTPTPGSNG